MVDSSTALPRVGQRIEAIRMISWTVEEFEDYPLVVQSGNRGTITEVDESQRRVCVEWDDDEFKHMRKCLSLEGTPESWPFRML
jgi:hypothetical protein